MTSLPPPAARSPTHAFPGGVESLGRGQSCGRQGNGSERGLRPRHPPCPARAWNPVEPGLWLPWYTRVRILLCPVLVVRCGTSYLTSLSLSSHLSSGITGLASQRQSVLWLTNAREGSLRSQAPRWQRVFVAANLYLGLRSWPRPDPRPRPCKKPILGAEDQDYKPGCASPCPSGGARGRQS